MSEFSDEMNSDPIYSSMTTIQDLQDEMKAEFDFEQYLLHHTDRELEDY